MEETVKQKKRWFLKAELVVLICILCIWIVKLVTIDSDTALAGKHLTVEQATEESIDSHEKANSEAEILKKFNKAVGMVGNVQTQKEETEQLKVEAEELQKLDAERRDIDAFITSRQAEIEAWYSKSLADLEAEAERKFTQLKGEKKAAYLRSFQEMKKTKKVSEKLVAELDRLRKSEQETEFELRAAKSRLDRARQYKLIYLEEEAQRRRDVLAWKRRCVSKKIQQGASDNNAPLTEVIPRIQAICFSNNAQPIVYVRGRFAREGDIIDGFKILRIYPDKVEFDKDGETVTGIFSSH